MLEILYKYCTCGNKLIYHDNSIESNNGENGEMHGLYYCNKCDIIFNSDYLDEDNKYVKVRNKKYKKWFK